MPTKIVCGALLLFAAALAAPLRADIITPGGPLTPKTAGVAGKVPEVSEAIERLKAGEIPAAVAKLQSAAARNPGLPPPKLMMARLLLATRQDARARAFLEEAVAEAPAHPGPRTLLGDLALGEGRLADAELQFEKARALAASDSLPAAVRRESLNAASAGLAGVSERRGRWAEALAAITEWADREPRDAQAQLRAARVLFKLDRVADARARLDRSSQLDPALDPPGTTLGVFYSDAGRFDDAFRVMKEAVEAAPKDPRPRLGLALWLLGRERYAEARDQAAAALAIEPGGARARLLLGTAALRLGDGSAAEEHLEAAFGAAPDNLDVVDKLALTLASSPVEAKRSKARELAEANVRRSGGLVATLATLGRVQALAGQPDEAMKTLGATTQGDRATPEVAYGLALALDAQGHPEEAARLLKSALDAPIGQFPSRLDARRKLDGLGSPAKPSGASRQGR